MFGLEDIISKSDVISCPEGKVVELGGKYEMISMGFSNITPWNCPRDIPEEELKKKIDSMTGKVRDMKKAIFNIHVPPYDSSIDIAPKLDQNLKPLIGPGGEPIPYSAGSTAVRKAIENYQPLLGLHGHIHESKGKSVIGRTLCLNPGSEYQNGMLKGVIVDLNDKIDFCFTSS
jgi:Icc-related predicted phosphoesterase